MSQPIPSSPSSRRPAQLEGAGFTVRRPFPTAASRRSTRSCCSTRWGPRTWRPARRRVRPDHPHRGFETVTYMLDGAMEHEDSAGQRRAHRTRIVQWMTAGAGVVHSEMPARDA